MNDFVVRGIRAEEWRQAKALRLEALKDSAASIAFLETYEDAAARPDSFWQERALGAGEAAGGARQFVAEADGREWVGSVTVLVEEAGSLDWAGMPVERRQGHVVAVYVRPEWRGGAVTRQLFEAGVEWAWEAGLERVRLLVHQDNLRAQGAYRKVGFVPSGVKVPVGEGFGDFSGEVELEFVRERG
ncbi:GNAT family N-acetyltransferase [Streptomyces sp. NBC_00582]|uniref:GNAT family N-acetyltransferase n=1 Tax=Streptomyces sp. NBC_00582 TaxID=2975783 RepID=UPI0010642919|nr:GNAT family N-acetyltransferase [Streptomyces sp. NBC_00582]WUB63490.1 GNAT family N-acetyltransferase [Streptomyces sp. NBC_00582]